MPDPELNQLRALASVVDEGSFENAAARLHVTPSAISQRIKALESAAGQVLVRRVKPPEVTEAGQRYLRMSRQIAVLLADSDTDAATERAVVVPIAINGDSLTSWALPALAPLTDRVAFDLHREDQDHSAALLRAGTVMAAITSDAEPIQGCSVSRLGVMRYRAMASPKFAKAWFSRDIKPNPFAVAPMVVYDRKDDLQDRFLRARHRHPLAPPRHYVPGAAEFGSAVSLGFGWGMMPDLQSADAESRGELVDLEPGNHLDVTLYWQQWSLDTPVLSAISAAIHAAARKALT
jgi:LysR family transcriptional regulator (chromosome initiation inhibitor)